MNPLLTKEVRLLFPAWIAALLLVVVSILAVPRVELNEWENWFTSLPLATLTLGIVLVAVSSFAREFMQQTFQLILSQPVARAELWQNKIRTLGIASFSVWLVFWVLLSAFHGFSPQMGFLSLAAAATVASTGLWVSLLFRHAAGAFCLSLLVVILFSFLLYGLTVPLFESARLPVIVTIGTVYAVSAFLFARWLFQRAQDLDSWNVNLELLLPGTRRNTTSAPNPPGASRHPIRALVVKEFRLHQLTLMGASLLYLAILLPTLLFIRDDNSPAFEAVQALILLLCLLLPILIGAAAVAEERKLGVHQAIQCLPVSPITRFLIKLAVAAQVLILLALVFPLTVHGLVVAVTGLRIAGDDGWWNLLKPFGTYSLISGVLAWYFSSLARTTLAALISTIVTLAVGFYLIALGMENWHGIRLFLLMAIPACLVTALVLSGQNTREHLPNARVWRRDAVRFAAVALGVLVLSPWIYYRTWEWVLPEPAIGPPHPALADGALIHGGRSSLPWVVHLPDGRVWLAHSPDAALHSDRTYPSSFPGGGEFLDHDDWLRFAATFRNLFGLRADGTLWEIVKSPADSDGTQFTIQPFAEEARWQDLAAGDNHFLAVKEDGSLWGWGYNSRYQLSDERLRERIETPIRVADDDDWRHIAAVGGYSLAAKEDGSLWHWGATWGREAHFPPVRFAPSLLGIPVHLTGRSSVRLAVLDDGSLWALSWPISAHGPGPQPRRIGSDNDWAFAAPAWHGAFAAVKNDGSLWGHNVTRHEHARQEILGPVKPLTSDPVWASVTTGFRGVYALAQDGTWWMWERPTNYYDAYLAPTRRPQRIDASQ